jgi:uncharacterized protein involved in outer membrane biogenesis/outer membrane protein OmpA-like peptidoglycan-associated protein
MWSERSRRWAGRLRGLVTRTWVLVTVGVLAALAVAYTLVGFFLVPRLVRTYVPRYVQEQLKRRAEIGEVRLNPLLFKLEIKHFRLQEADGRPLLGFDRLFVDFELSSLFRRAWTFAEIQLEGPRLDVVLARDGRLNIAELLDAFPKSEPAPRPAAPRRVVLEHAVVRAGAMSLTDLTGREPQTAKVNPINVELHNITTLPDSRGPYAISATLAGGGVVGWQGEASLVPLRSTGRLGLHGFPLSTVWRFAQDRVALAEPAGLVDADIRYDVAYPGGTPSLKLEGLDVTVAGLGLAQRDKTPLLTLEKIRLVGGHGDLVTRELTVPEISVSRGRIAVTMTREGVLNWQRLMPDRPAEAAPAAAGGSSAPQVAPPAAGSEVRPWRVAIDKVGVEEVALGFVDQSRAAPLEVDVGDVTLALSAKLESGPAGLAGTVEDLGLKLARAAVRQAGATKAPLVSLDQISVDGVRADLGAHRVAVSRVAVTGGASTVVRAADGSVPLVTMLGPADQRRPGRPSAADAAPPRPAPAASAKPWTVTLAKLDLAGHRLAIADQSVTPPVQLDLTGLTASARDLQTDGKKAFPFEASFRVAQGGRFTARGRVAPDASSAEATLRVARLALTAAQPYVARTADAELRSGEVSTAGRLTYRKGRDRATVTYTGSADIDDLNLVETATGDSVVVWRSLHADTLRFGLAPDRLEIDELRLTGLDGKLVVFKDKTLSVSKLMKPTAASADTPSPNGPPVGTSAPGGPAAAPAGGDAAPGFPVVVERVRIDDGSMDFSDLSLVLPFATRVHALNGVVAGLGSDPESRATMKLDGKVDEFGVVKVEGALSAFRPKTFTDITVMFRNVPMSTLTPYSATFAGRRIKGGTMDVDLQYKVDRSELEGENKVVLRQLQLGEQVESPGATRLPLDLAIAILSDSEGKIDIALPVKGNVDNPQFSYGHVIWQALVTLIKRIVTSPFRALAGLFGGGGDVESLQTIAFAPGSATVRPPEQQKLQRVAEMLGKRTRLKLTVHGGYEAAADGEALRSLRVRQELAQRLGVKARPGEDPGPVAFDQAKTQRALEALLTERGGAKAVEEFRAGYEHSSGKKAERVNPVLALVGRGSPDRAFYEALYHRLVELTPLGDAEMKALGQHRAEAIARVLKERAGASADRVEVGDPEAAGRGERNAVPIRLELGAVGS